MDSRVASFAPVIGRTARILVLGSMPGLRSLAHAQYYAHPKNLFWPFMGEICGAGPELAYADRLRHLTEAGIALWDVLGECKRVGSLDTAIRTMSETPNDVAGLLARHPELHTIAFNGAKARQAFRRHVEPDIDAKRFAQLRLLALPSTSPANASVPRAEKRERWLVLREWIAAR
jgi:hypoxanthine-DNA glycosylase